MGLRIDPGRWQPARPDRSERGPRQDPRGRIRQRSRGRGLASRRRPGRSQHRLLARVLRELHPLERRAVRLPTARPAPSPRARQRGRARTRRRHARSGRKSADVELRAQWMAPIITSRARAGRDLRGIPVRLSFGQSRRVVGADQPGPDVERSVAHAAAEQQRDPVPDDHGARRIAAPARPALCGNRRRQAARDTRTTARPGPS